ncbi:hypothetical protein GV819_28610 [Pseudomonas sp. Fl5BN2]|nr:hypothetical protein [Pseudomonas sp. Fl5BN2]NBF13237.1 hypothetical protein [Pseudomonas sp. Fl4BN1]
MENGTVTAGRIEVLNATPKIQAQLDESFRQSERSTAQLTATYRANPTWAKFDDKSNAVELPDVASLNQNDATHVLKGLQYLLDIGRLDGKAISARNGGLSTDSTAVYQDWLQAQIGVDVHA